LIEGLKNEKKDKKKPKVICTTDAVNTGLGKENGFSQLDIIFARDALLALFEKYSIMDFQSDVIFARDATLT
jgi:hypothetical protein